MLDDRQRDALLAVARASLTDALSDASQSGGGAGVSPYTGDPVEPIHADYSGIFVTLDRRGELRGCIGSFRDIGELVEATRDAAEASLTDPRFRHNPITLAELPQLTIEISLLSPREPMQRPEQLQIGTHGIVVRCGEQGGCFLPKVASQRRWTAEEFLANCCTMKAGLPADAWRREGAEVWLFSAEVFSDRRQLVP